MATKRSDEYSAAVKSDLLGILLISGLRLIGGVVLRAVESSCARPGMGKTLGEQESSSTARVLTPLRRLL